MYELLHEVKNCSAQNDNKSVICTDLLQIDKERKELKYLNIITNEEFFVRYKNVLSKQGAGASLLHLHSSLSRKGRSSPEMPSSSFWIV